LNQKAETFMKKAKILLTITVVLALVGGAFAVKTSRASTARNGAWVCTTSSLPVATCSLPCRETNIGQGTWWYCTKRINPGYPCNFLLFGTTDGA
jgi:hypothetical protein